MITYIDQNNNTYRLSPKMISYTGTSPRNSSSGTYSGGPDKSATIPPTAFQSVVFLSEELIQDSSFHAPRREMTTSVLKVKQKTGHQEVTLYSSEKRTEFEKLLKQLLP